MIRPLLLFLIVISVVPGSSRDRYKKSFTQDAGAYIGTDKLRPTTDTTPIKIQNKAGSSDIMIIDLGDMQIGVKKTPTEDLDVSGNVKATAFIGDGSQLSGLTVTGASLPNFTITTTDYQAQAKEYILVDSNAGSITITPPAAIAGTWFVVADIGQASVNPIRILSNSAKIQGVANNLSIDESRVWVRFAYSDASRGWIIRGP